MPAACAAGMGPLKLSAALRCQGPAVGGVAISLNGNPLPRVDEAVKRLRERKRRCGCEKPFKLIAVLPRQTVGEVFASVSHAAQGRLKDSDTGMTATQLLVPIIHEIEARGE